MQGSTTNTKNDITRM